MWEIKVTWEKPGYIKKQLTLDPSRAGVTCYVQQINFNEHEK